MIVYSLLVIQQGYLYFIIKEPMVHIILNHESFPKNYVVKYMLLKAPF